MKLKIDGYEVEIAVREPDNKHFSNEATKYFLNKLSLLASVASSHYIKEGYKGLAAEADRVSDDIYNFLEGQGLYNF